MSLLQGTLSAARHLVLGPVPDFEQLMQGLVQDQFRPFQDGMEEERLGWADWRNLLLTPPDPEWVAQERFWVFALRIDTRKVPTALLKGHVQMRLESLRKEKDLAFIGKEARISLEEEVKAQLLGKIIPTPKAYEVVWDFRGGQLWTAATSQKAQGALTSLFIKSFGCELHPQVPMILAGRVAPGIPSEGLMALDPFDLECEVVHG